MKPLIGLAVAFAIGLACRAFGIPSPAPPVVVGALLVMTMTLGYVAVDRWIAAHPAQHAANCGGPSGQSLGTAAASPALLARIAWLLALLGLCAAYIQGGLAKLLDFPGAVAEATDFGLPLPPLAAAITILIELGGTILILTGRLRWLGALALAVFTLMASFIANRFWTLPPGQARFMSANGFFEHLGLVGGFLLVALQDRWKR